VTGAFICVPLLFFTLIASGSFEIMKIYNKPGDQADCYKFSKRSYQNAILLTVILAVMWATFPFGEAKGRLWLLGATIIVSVVVVLCNVASGFFWRLQGNRLANQQIKEE